MKYLGTFENWVCQIFTTFFSDCLFLNLWDFPLYLVNIFADPTSQIPQIIVEVTFDTNHEVQITFLAMQVNNLTDFFSVIIEEVSSFKSF